MYSVTQRIKTIKQPYGGYVKPSSFEIISLEDGFELYENENIYTTIIGLAVDYLTRMQTGAKKEDAFRVSLTGAQIIQQEKKAKVLLNSIEGLDDNSIINACKLSGYDVCLRAGPAAYKPVDGINPNLETINNIRIMVKRSCSFFEEYGPVIQEGLTFDGGYTRLISSGDAGFITKDTLWDFKVSKNRVTSQQTLQLLMYYLMGKRSTNENFKQITKLGIFNPRLNTVFVKEINDIPADVIETVENEVIGYYGNDVKIIEEIVSTQRAQVEETTMSKAQQKKPDNVLTIADLMQVMQCSRHMVMKAYSEQGLPLKKVGSRYQITKEDFECWVYVQNKKIEEEQERRRKTKSTLIIVFMVGIVIAIAILVAKFFLFK